MKEKFDVEGMTCAACQAHVQSAVEKLDGIKAVNVSLLDNSMIVEFDEKISDVAKIESAVKKAGYAARARSNKAHAAVTKSNDGKLARLIVSVILLLTLMYFSMGNMMWGFPAPDFVDHMKNPVGFGLLQLVLTLPIVILNGNYFTSGFKKLFRGKPNMDSLIAIGASASLIYGIVALFIMTYAQSMIALGNASWQSQLTTYHDSLYFESAGMILTLVSLGKYLEGLSKKKTTAAVTKLMDLAPKRGTVIRDGVEVEIPAEEIIVGDEVIVKNGDAIPVDGVVTEGSASVDQSNITGESIPVSKTPGDEIFSSTTVTAGYIKLRANKVGEDTSIAAIIKLVDEAANSKAPISKLADKISGVFVPVIFVIALVTLAANLLAGSTFELSLNFAITVIVIACPCALGLATPVAIMAGTGKGAQNGLLIKNAEILEKAQSIKTVVLDKTGTLTQGKPSVVYFENLTNKDSLNAVYSLENLSEHPLARAICDYARSHGGYILKVNDYKSIEGKGISGDIDGTTYSIGNLRFSEGDSALEEKFAKLSRDGKTPLAVFADGVPIAVLAIKDEVKPTSAAAVGELSSMGIKVVMLTGDNKQTAKAIADEIGIEEVIAEVYPQDKQNVINALRRDDKHPVAMVGDGVNDAPALAAADIGIAIGGGSDVAIETSDIVLLRNDLMDVANAIRLSKRVLRTIKLGLFWAFFYNFVCVVIATGAFYYVDSRIMINPMIGSIAMSVSSVSVVLNALTINFFKVKRSNIPNDAPEAERATIPSYASAPSETFDEHILTLNIKGMMCSNCERHVQEACLSVDGVKSAKATAEKGIVVICSDGEIDLKKIKQRVKDAGYEVVK